MVQNDDSEEKMQICQQQWHLTSVGNVRSMRIPFITCGVPVKKQRILVENKYIKKNNIPKTPELFLLGVNMEKIDNRDRTAIWYMTTAARLVYAEYWKKDIVPEIQECSIRCVFLIWSTCLF